MAGCTVINHLFLNCSLDLSFQLILFLQSFCLIVFLYSLCTIRAEFHLISATASDPETRSAWRRTSFLAELKIGHWP
ncbi:uncharacterized protein BDV14DRAFT_27590 [Aspergillus stella-maris]|uniref:uncharacterized protein n=1 Tax=Aspergillus stella-maris TaxID=1810926 RepID=UPI003CCDC1FD